MEILRIYQEEYCPIMYDVTKHLILLKIQNVIDVNVDLHQSYIKSLVKRLLPCMQINLLVVIFKIRLCQTNN